MSLEEILNMDIDGRDILIIGLPASGKSFLANKLALTNDHVLVRTDLYKSSGYEQGLYDLMEDLRQDQEHELIVEGVLGFRYLRKIQEDSSLWQPEVIIECIVPQWKQEEIYNSERDPKKLKAVKSFNKGLQSVYNDWHLNTPEHRKPTIIEFNNDWK